MRGRSRGGRRGGTRTTRRLRRFVGDLFGLSHRRIVDVLVRQIDTAVEGAGLARSMAMGEVAPGPARSRMADIEHSGDAHRAVLVAEIGAALTTPIDREDLFRLSRSIDDVLDNLRDYVRESDLFDTPHQPAAAPLVSAVADGLAALRTAVRALVGEPGRVIESALVARKIGNRVRQLHQHEVAALFARGTAVDVLKRRDLLRRLDVVGTQLGECADALSDGMLKRS